MKRRLRELQKLVGIAALSVGAGFYDWRAGIVAFGILILADLGLDWVRPA